mmetsp:Transcript_22548/g.72918  ORF Transcript_22548/g.72918 Transcript_22548/m.72918 type:complete len:217 (-) Transcript_22548:873-1523(-)
MRATRAYGTRSTTSSVRPARPIRTPRSASAPPPATTMRAQPRPPPVLKSRRTRTSCLRCGSRGRRPRRPTRGLHGTCTRRRWGPRGALGLAGHGVCSQPSAQPSRAPSLRWAAAARTRRMRATRCTEPESQAILGAPRPHRLQNGKRMPPPTAAPTTTIPPLASPRGSARRPTQTRPWVQAARAQCSPRRRMCAHPLRAAPHPWSHSGGPLCLKPR